MGSGGRRVCVLALALTRQLLNKLLLRAQCVPGAADTAVNKTKFLLFRRLYSYGRR